MTERKHTPGPWRVAIEEAGLYYPGHTPISTCKGTGNFQWDGFAQVATTVDGLPSLEGQANARLIAAAPDLLEAAELAADAMFIAMGLAGAEPAETSALGKLRAAIAKATSP